MAKRLYCGMLATMICAVMVFPSIAWADNIVAPPAWSGATGCARHIYLFPNDSLTPSPDASTNLFGSSEAVVSLGQYAAGWQDPTADPPGNCGEPGSGAWDLGKGPAGTIRVTVPVGNVASIMGFTGYNVDIQVNVVAYGLLVGLPSLSAEGYALSNLTQTDTTAHGSGFDVWKNRTWTAQVTGVMADHITLVIAAHELLGATIDTIEIYAMDADARSPIKTALDTPVAWFQSFAIGPAPGDDWNAVDAYDSDNDGMFNWQEYVAGTNPQDPRSLLKIVRVQVAPGDRPHLEWLGGTLGPTAPYIIESTPSLKVLDWQPVGTRARANGTNDWTGDKALPGTIRFFRVIAPRDTP